MVGKITALAHEVGDHSVKARSFISIALLSGTKLAKVLGGFGRNIGTKLKSNAANGISTDLHVKVHLWVAKERVGLREGPCGKSCSSRTRGSECRGGCDECGEHGELHDTYTAVSSVRELICTYVKKHHFRLDALSRVAS